MRTPEEVARQGHGLDEDYDPCPRCGGDHDRIDRRELCPAVTLEDPFYGCKEEDSYTGSASDGLGFTSAHCWTEYDTGTCPHEEGG